MEMQPEFGAFPEGPGRGGAADGPEPAAGPLAIRIVSSRRSARHEVLSRELLLRKYAEKPPDFLPRNPPATPESIRETVESFRAATRGKRYRSPGEIIAELGLPDRVSVWRRYGGRRS